MKSAIEETVEELVSAAELDERNILSKGTAYKMSALGLIPSYKVGCKKRGVKFRVSEVLAALRQPQERVSV
jgi:hypothetical protein